MGLWLRIEALGHGAEKGDIRETFFPGRGATKDASDEDEGKAPIR
jgi:hypothetical protein